LGGYRAGGKGVCGRLMSPAHETQSMREIRLLRGRLPRKGGGLTGMPVCWFSLGTLVSCSHQSYLHDVTEILLKVVLNTHKPIDDADYQVIFCRKVQIVRTEFNID
jgi:hypothetical protein